LGGDEGRDFDEGCKGGYIFDWPGQNEWSESERQFYWLIGWPTGQVIDTRRWGGQREGSTNHWELAAKMKPRGLGWGWMSHPHIILSSSSLIIIIQREFCFFIGHSGKFAYFNLNDDSVSELDGIILMRKV
jgi:hypothetical protein